MFEDWEPEETLAYSVIGGCSLAGAFIIAACIVHVATMDPAVLKEQEARAGRASATDAAIFGATMGLPPAPGLSFPTGPGR